MADTPPTLAPWTRSFLALASDCRALKFGTFKLKSGRSSPYFFNAGAFDHGASLATLGGCYADALAANGPDFDMLFGPAYKGIPLAAATAIALAERHGRDVPFAFDRKEAKDHGEGGTVVGAPLTGRVMIVDDVISAGTSVRHSVDLIRAHGAEPAGVVIALDRQERGAGESSAADEVRAGGLAVTAIASLDDLLAWLDEVDTSDATRSAMLEYRRRFGV